MKKFSVSSVIAMILRNKDLIGARSGAIIVEKYFGGYKMEGFIKIECATRNGDQGLLAEVNLRNVSDLDRFHVLSCIQRSMGLSVEDFEFFAFAMRSGLLDKTLDVDVLEHESVEGPSDDFIKALLHRED